MRFASQEDRLNPVPPQDADEATLGGYAAIHGRVAAFEGSDGYAYTAAVETERTPTPEDPARPWAGYLVFLRWAQNGSAVLGHLETADLATAASEAEVRQGLESLRLQRVREILDREIRRRADDLPPA